MQQMFRFSYPLDFPDCYLLSLHRFMTSNFIRYFLFIVASALTLASCNNNNDASLIHNPASDKPMTAEDSARMPIIAFDTLEHNFGEIKEGDEATYEFKFKNNGKGNLLITEVHATCGCTTPYYPKNIIKPGESDAIKVVYNSKGRPGIFNKGVTVTSNTYPNTTKLTIRGTVKPSEE